MNTLVLVIVIVSSMILVGINVWLLWFTKLIYDVSVRIFDVSEKLLDETIILKDDFATRLNKSLTGNDRVVIE